MGVGGEEAEETYKIMSGKRSLNFNIAELCSFD